MIYISFSIRPGSVDKRIIYERVPCQGTKADPLSHPISFIYRNTMKTLCENIRNTILIKIADQHPIFDPRPFDIYFIPYPFVSDPFQMLPNANHSRKAIKSNQFLAAISIQIEH